MIFTSKDLAKAMGVEIGDFIKVDGIRYLIKEDFSCEDVKENFIFSLGDFVDCEYETQQSDKVGNLKCTDIDCENCPLRTLSCISAPGKTLYEMLDLSEADTDKEMYDLMKNRLDKEVN